MVFANQENRASDDELASRLLTVAEFAALLRVRPQTIRLWVSQRRIPHFKIGRCVRFRRSDMQGWLEEHRRDAASFYVEAEVPGVRR